MLKRLGFAFLLALSAWSVARGTQSPVNFFPPPDGQSYPLSGKPFEPGRYVRMESGESSRVVLVELFTGTECGPCVAADLVIDGIGERYDRRTVAVLSYHLHVPGPDPMTNPDSEMRARYYRVRATPAMLLDGLDMHAGGGSSSLAPELFEACRLRIESRIRRRAFARFSTIAATRVGDVISVSGRVTVTSEWILDPRLRIALVEDAIRYSGANRIPYHNFVLRKFLGPAEGFVLQKESNEFLESASVRSISDELRQHATRVEKERSDIMGAEFRFTGDAGTINPERISLVLFVQDARTREVLQAAVLKPETGNRRQE